MMRDIFDVLIAAASLFAGWWACDIYRDDKRQRDVSPLLPYPVGEPPSNVLSIVEDDGEGLIL